MKGARFPSFGALGRLLALAGVLWGCNLVVSGPAAAETPADGLREALTVGTGRAVDVLGRAGGYLDNEDVRIPLPPKFKKLSRGLRRLGRGDVVDEFEVSMNRAAEAAAPLAREVFVQTVKGMSFRDAMAILRGQGHEATDYLVEHAGPKLTEMFQPIVEKQLDEVGTTQVFNDFMGQAEKIPFSRRPSFDLAEYVTGKTLDGLFLMIAREEEGIRKDPVKRTTSLLKKFFGGDGS